MLALRSFVFNVYFYINMLVWMLGCLIPMVLPRKQFLKFIQAYQYSWLVPMRWICGTRYEFRGQEHLPEGGAILAVKHQSTWETLALYLAVRDPCFILKRELMWIPLFGLYPWKTRMIPIDRKGGSATLAKMNAVAEVELAEGRQILIFPEGTRRSPDAEPAYKFGFINMYAAHNVPLVPVALNSGVFWPRRRFLRYPGTIVIEFLPPIPPGGGRREVFNEAVEAIETASARLRDEARAEARAAGRPIG
jgi:1-acyl-sn-glycerol-3-phosphate acyltransferase